MINKTPLYNLNAVLREVSVSADVLRAWERRYELPIPQRTPGGHRLYSEYDIEIIRWLKARQQEGLSISHAVSLWHELSANGDPLENLGQSMPVSVDQLKALTGGIDSFRGEWISACLSFDTASAESTLNQAISLFPVERVCIQILQRGLSEIGEQWHLGSASVQQEHFATAMAHNRIQALITGTPSPLFNRTILIACPPSEQHTFPGLLLNLLIRREGFKVIYLGADVPLEQLTDTADDINPNLVVLTAQRLPSASTLSQAAALLAARGHQVAYGGLIFTRVPELTRRVAGHYLGNSLEASIVQVKEFTLHPQRFVAPEEASLEMKNVSEAYVEHRGLVEHRVTHLLRDQSISIPNLAEINSFFGDSLAAVLALGNIEFMNPDIEWVMSLHHKEIQTTDLLPFYMRAYQQALSEELGADAAPITEWIIRTFIDYFTKEK